MDRTIASSLFDGVTLATHQKKNCKKKTDTPKQSQREGQARGESQAWLALSLHKADAAVMNPALRTQAGPDPLRRWSAFRSVLPLPYC